MVSFTRKTGMQTDVVSPATSNIGMVLFNKTNIGGLDRFVRVRGLNPKVCEYLVAKDKAPSAQITYGNTTFTNQGNEFDHNDDSYMRLVIPASVTDYMLLLLDFGTVKPRFFYGKLYIESDTPHIYLKTSEDGQNWITHLDATNYATVAGGRGLSFRYLKISGTNSYAAGHYARVYTIEVFDVDDCSKLTQGTGICTIEHKMLNINDIVTLGVIADGPVKYYVYDYDDVKISLIKGEVEV